MSRKIFATLAAAAAVLGSQGPTAYAAEESHGYNNGDTGFVNLSVTGPIARRANADLLSMVGHCTFNQTVVPFSSDAVVQVIGKAAVTARDNSKVLGTAVRCVIKDVHGTVYFDKWDGLPANTAAWTQVYQAKVERLVVCTQVKALLSSGDVVSQSFPCKEPSVLPG